MPAPQQNPHTTHDYHNSTRTSTEHLNRQEPFKFGHLNVEDEFSLLDMAEQQQPKAIQASFARQSFEDSGNTGGSNNTIKQYG